MSFSVKALGVYLRKEIMCIKTKRWRKKNKVRKSPVVQRRKKQRKKLEESERDRQYRKKQSRRHKALATGKRDELFWLDEAICKTSSLVENEKENKERR